MNIATAGVGAADVTVLHPQHYLPAVLTPGASLSKRAFAVDEGHMARRFITLGNAGLGSTWRLLFDALLQSAGSSAALVQDIEGEVPKWAKWLSSHCIARSRAEVWAQLRDLCLARHSG